MRPLDARVQDQENAPIAGKAHPRDHRWDLRHGPPASVDRQAAALEQCDAHARTRAAIEQTRILPRVERQFGQPAKRRRDRQRKLSPGPKSGVRGDRIGDSELLSGIEAKAFGDAAHDMRAPLALLAQKFKAWRFAKLDAGFERVDGETNRSEPAAKISGEIEKTQMQARRRRHLNAFQLRASSSIIRRLRFQANSSELCETLRVLPSAEYENCMTARWRAARRDLAGCAANSTGPIGVLRPLVQNATLVQ